MEIVQHWAADAGPPDAKHRPFLRGQPSESR